MTTTITKTDRQRMNAAFRALRAAGYDARHAASDLRAGIRLGTDPRDAYTAGGDLWGAVRVTWMASDAHLTAVLDAFRDQGLIAAPALPFPDPFWPDDARRKLCCAVVGTDHAVVSAVRESWDEDVEACISALDVRQHAGSVTPAEVGQLLGQLASIAPAQPAASSPRRARMLLLAAVDEGLVSDADAVAWLIAQQGR